MLGSIFLLGSFTTTHLVARFLGFFKAAGSSVAIQRKHLLEVFGVSLGLLLASQCVPLFYAKGISVVVITIFLGSFLYRHPEYLRPFYLQKRGLFQDLKSILALFLLAATSFLILTFELLPVSSALQSRGFSYGFLLADKFSKAWLLTYITWFLMCGFVAETLFRGFLFNYLKARYKVYQANILVSLSYALFIVWLFYSAISFDVFLYAFFGSLYLTGLYQKTGSLKSCFKAYIGFVISVFLWVITLVVLMMIFD